MLVRSSATALVLLALLGGCAHNTASRDAAEFARSVVFVAEAEIDAPPEVVFDVVADFASYPAWNPWLTAIDGPAKPGSRMVAEIVLGGRTRRAPHLVMEVERPTRFCWRDRGATTAFAYGQRCRTFERRADGGTSFRVELLVAGPFTRTVERRFGAELQLRLREETAALKGRAEGLGTP